MHAISTTGYIECAVSLVVNPSKKTSPNTGRGGSLSQNEQAYDLLKAALTTLAYKPGEYLNTASLMNELALGRTPINHALHRLSTEGLIQIIPRKGVLVSPLSINDALELIEVRMVLEGLCARIAAVKITEMELSQLKSLALDFDDAVNRRNKPQVMNLDRQFHELIAMAARNQILAEILKVLHARSQRFWAISFATEGHLQEVQAEHRTIIEALAKSDPDAATAAVESHVLSFKRSLLHAR